jgi:hypothetical protein
MPTPTALRSASIFSLRRALLLSGVIAMTVVSFAHGDMIDLSNNLDTSLHQVDADVGGQGLVGNFHSQPAGTGVFNPFLTLERNASGGNPSNLERAYNTNGSPLYLDQQRPNWNTYLRFGDLGTFKIGSAYYFAFELDANEPGFNSNSKDGTAGRSLISIDNVRIYTSGSDTTGSVKSDESKLNDLGTLRWAMNDPLGSDPYNVDEWIKLDSTINATNKNGGSGISDLVLYVPVTAFAGTNANDYVWFYNLNGVRFEADGEYVYEGTNINLGAEAGYEEWRAFAGPQVVPDGGSTLVLMGLALAGIGAVAGSRKRFAQAEILKR